MNIHNSEKDSIIKFSICVLERERRRRKGWNWVSKLINIDFYINIVCLFIFICCSSFETYMYYSPPPSTPPSILLLFIFFFHSLSKLKSKLIISSIFKNEITLTIPLASIHDTYEALLSFQLGLGQEHMSHLFFYCLI